MVSLWKSGKFFTPSHAPYVDIQQDEREPLKNNVNVSHKCLNKSADNVNYRGGSLNKHDSLLHEKNNVGYPLSVCFGKSIIVLEFVNTVAIH